MPYITPEQRKQIKHGRDPMDAGELNYVITKTILHYWHCNPKYQTANDIVGALDGAKAEFQRRQLAAYEDSKILENGDV